MCFDQLRTKERWQIHHSKFKTASGFSEQVLAVRLQICFGLSTQGIVCDSAAKGRSIVFISARRSLIVRGSAGPSLLIKVDVG